MSCSSAGCVVPGCPFMLTVRSSSDVHNVALSGDGLTDAVAGTAAVIRADCFDEFGNAVSVADGELAAHVSIDELDDDDELNPDVSVKVEGTAHIFTYLAQAAGDINICVAHNGQLVADGDRTVHVRAAECCAPLCELDGFESATAVCVVAGTEVGLHVLSRDRFGNSRGDNDEFECRIVDQSSERRDPSTRIHYLTLRGPSQWRAALAGEFVLFITHNGVSIGDCPYMISVAAAGGIGRPAMTRYCRC